VFVDEFVTVAARSVMVIAECPARCHGTLEPPPELLEQLSAEPA
jgi:hypothetical protein